MAYRPGVNQVPFEQRCPPPRPGRREPLTAGDRLVCAVMGAFLGLVLWTAGYFILVAGAMKAVGRANRNVPAAQFVDPFDRLPPFAWGGGVAVGFGLFGAVVGAERMMDAFEAVLRVEGQIAERVNRA